MIHKCISKLIKVVALHTHAHTFMLEALKYNQSHIQILGRSHLAIFKKWGVSYRSSMLNSSSGDERRDVLINIWKSCRHCNSDSLSLSCSTGPKSGPTIFRLTPSQTQTFRHKRLKLKAERMYRWRQRRHTFIVARERKTVWTSSSNWLTPLSWTWPAFAEILPVLGARETKCSSVTSR